MHLELQIVELDRFECLRLSVEADRHLPSGGVAVGEIEHHQRPAIIRSQARHRVRLRIGDLAGRQIQIGVIADGDPVEYWTHEDFSPTNTR